ncbi:MAG: hypothetical protein WCK33_02470 [Phycisphaerae bacterium]|jgi:hypothetical protein
MDRTTSSHRRLLTVAAAGLASLLALHAIGGAPPVGGGSSARAGMVSQAGQHTILTADANNEDLVLVLDERSEELLVYRTDINKGVQLFQRLRLPEVFIDARARASGR